MKLPVPKMNLTHAYLLNKDHSDLCQNNRPLLVQSMVWLLHTLLWVYKEQDRDLTAESLQSWEDPTYRSKVEKAEADSCLWLFGKVTCIPVYCLATFMLCIGIDAKNDNIPRSAITWPSDSDEYCRMNRI